MPCRGRIKLGFLSHLWDIWLLRTVTGTEAQGRLKSLSGLFSRRES